MRMLRSVLTSRLNEFCGKVLPRASDVHIEAGWRVAGGPVHRRAAAPGETDVHIDPFAPTDVGVLQFWFHLTTPTPSTCEVWDSSNPRGTNYRTTIHNTRTGTIVFDGAKGSIPSTAALPSGGVIAVTYPGGRVPGCFGPGQEGQHTVQAQWRFDRQVDVHSTKFDSVFNPTGQFAVEVPPGAHHLEMWFNAHDDNNCHDWDSRDGGNYFFGLK